MNIFIAAFPRSGTTFLAKKIVEHFGLYSSPESHFLFHIYRAINNHGAITKKQLSAILEKDFKYRVWDICPELPEILNSDNLLDFYEQLIACYNKVSIDQVRANLTLDHTPENMINQDFIHHFFPKSLHLRLVRDPRAIFASIKKVKWGPNNVLSFLTEWESSERAWLNRPPNTAYFDIKFENFVTDSASVLNELKDILGNYLSDPNARFILPSYTQKQHQLVSSGKADKGRIEAWKQVLSKREIELIEGSDWVQDYFKKYHYTFMTNGRKPTYIEQSLSRPINTITKGINRIKRKVDGDEY